MSKHTPGPWELRGRTVKGPHPRYEGELRTVASAQWSKGTWKDEAEANARLIAAAPDMLQALQEMIANCDRWLETGIPADAEESKRLYNQMAAALKKAEGGQG